ncbi:MAG: peptidoglycan bridge formation glycyltransferase FemA/FemB family protein [Patescibacteria group bacterium]
MFDIREVTNKIEYNPLLIDKNAPFTQAWFYGEWQEAMGRKVRRFEIHGNSETLGFFQIIKYPLIFGKNILYIPHAVVLRSFSEGGARSSFLKIFREKLTQVAIEENAIFVRSEIKCSPDKFFKKTPSYALHSVYFQPKYEWILEIDKPENELLNGIPKKNRYDIRYAENKGIMTEIFKNDLNSHLEDFYSLMEKTASRSNFNLHSKKYYENILLNCEENNNAFFVTAKQNDNIIAMNFVLIFGETAYVVFGGSDDKFKNLRAPRLVYWKGIIVAKDQGCKFYNFGAVSSGGGYESYEGITEFKKGFGGKMLEHPDSYDLVIEPFWRWIYNLRKKIQNNYPSLL